MKILHIIALMLMLAGATGAADSLETELTGIGATAPKVAAKPESTGELDKIISGEEPIPMLTGAELKHRLERDWHDTRRWFRHEVPALRFFLIGTAVTVAAGFGVGLVLRRIRRRKLEAGNLRLHTEIFFALAGPVLVLLVILSVFSFFLPVLQSLPGLYTPDARLFFTAVMLTVAWAGMRLISVFSGRLTIYARREDNNLDALMVEITRKVAKIMLVAVTALVVGQNIFNLNITTLLAGAGVVGLAVAFASRETLSNFFGTLVIILDQPFRCGDRIQVDGVDGLVEAVGMRSTRILTGRESVYTIPNSKIAEANIENISRRGLIRYMFTLGMVYQTTAEEMEKAMKIAHEIVDDFHGADTARNRPRIYFDTFANSSMNINVIMWLKTSSYDTEEKWRTEINLAFVRRFSAEKLTMAYNTVTNVVTGDPGNPLYIASVRRGAETEA